MSKKISRIFANYFREIGQTLILIIATPINLGLLGLEGWSFYGLISALTIIILRFDAGIALLIQLEGAEHKNGDMNGSLFNEIELLYFFMIPSIGLLASFILLNFSFGSTSLIFAIETGVIYYLLFIVLAVFTSRIYEARLRGQSQEIVISVLAFLRNILVAFMPFLCLKILQLDLASVFKSIFACEFLILIFYIVVQRILTPVRSMASRFDLGQIRKNLASIKEAFSYQVIAFLSQGFDIILAGILLSIETFGLFALIITVTNLVDKLLKPILLFGSQEAYGSATKIPGHILNCVLRISFLVFLATLLCMGTILNIWLDNIIPKAVYPGIALLILGKILIYGFAPIWVNLNKKRKFTTRKQAYFFSVLVFYITMFLVYPGNGEMGIMGFCIAMFCRDIAICVYVSLSEKYFDFVKVKERAFFFEFLSLLILTLGLILLSAKKADIASLCALVALLILGIKFKSDIRYVLLRLKGHFLSAA